MSAAPSGSRGPAPLAKAAPVALAAAFPKGFLHGMGGAVWAPRCTRPGPH